MRYLFLIYISRLRKQAVKSGNLKGRERNTVSLARLIHLLRLTVCYMVIKRPIFRVLVILFDRVCVRKDWSTRQKAAGSGTLEGVDKPNPQESVSCRKVVRNVPGA
jgi:hypothetical protein